VLCRRTFVLIVSKTLVLASTGTNACRLVANLLIQCVAPSCAEDEERLPSSLAVIRVSLSLELLLACGMCWWRVRGSLGTWRSSGWIRPGVAMVHCRMSAFGSVVGGAESVVHPKLVHHLLGHASITMTLDRYSRWIPSMGRHAADGVDEALG
jgi:hypothetical protein